MIDRLGKITKVWCEWLQLGKHCCKLHLPQKKVVPLMPFSGVSTMHLIWSLKRSTELLIEFAYFRLFWKIGVEHANGVVQSHWSG